MLNANPTYFEIDLADIWNYACECHDPNKDSTEFKRLYYYLQPLFLASNIKPFASPELVSSGKVKQDYLDNYLFDRLPKIEYGFKLEAFEYSGAVYNMYTPCNILRDSVNLVDFQYLFALKLSQYKEGLLYINDFLGFHLEKSFDTELEDFQNFLRGAILQYSGLLSTSVIKYVKRYIKTIKQALTIEFKQDSNNHNKLLENSQANRETSYKEINDTIQEPMKDLLLIPSGYLKIEGRFSLAETKEFFSFLHLEKSVNGKPFLPKNAVEEMLKYGIAIPPLGAVTSRIRLNVSKRHPKAIIEYAIHRFYLLHAYGSLRKKEVLPFFCHYIEDFASALDSPEKMNLFISNVTGTKPKNMDFDLELYIPARFR